MLKRLCLLLLVASIAAPAFGQDEEKEKDTAKKAKRDEVLAALGLPKTAQALRKKGVEKKDVKEAIRQARGKKMKAKETKDLLDAAEKSVDENGPVDNFGAFVKSKLDSGLRGKDLAEAIRAEHKARGKGKGWKKKPDKGKKEKPGKGKEGDEAEDEKGEKPDKPEEPDRPERPDKPEKGKKPDDAGKGKGKGGKK